MGVGQIRSLMIIIFHMVLGLFAGGIGAWLEGRKQAAGKIRTGSGTVLVLLGLRMLLHSVYSSRIA